MKFRDLILPNDAFELYLVAGAVCAVRTNSESISAVMSGSFTRLAKTAAAPDVSMRFVVDGTGQNRRSWPKPYFRGLSHLVFAAFDSESEVLVDLRRQRIMGRFSQTIAADQAYFHRYVFPALFGIVSERIRITALHCACVAWKGNGLLLAGDSGSGKSTLSLALAQAGLTFLSDDWTYVSRRSNRVVAWSVNKSLKLLPNAVEHFPELGRIEPGVSLNGELAYELEPDHIFGIRRCEYAEPRLLIFLQRQEDQELNLTRISSTEAEARLEQDLEGFPATISGAKDFLLKTIRILVQVPCWKLRYGANTPRVVARSVLSLLDGHPNV